ncbi:hypothetical protein HUN01_00245 (plasmid) [Nostoc edaphicum CCNP1411]|uniref:Uncharacterized protein n=1 Tax=Nostoc edaphicum CCNP1411 TaxID=1472755 RepID=A0A7D7L8K2_9NOSO|nr:hypothetical protein [Nostoc edaphicum]QMS86098.1 hypothetical protein HUN01_00245 [Nostoc edaphicum CCNP1411]
MPGVSDVSQKGISVRAGFTRNGKSKGISYQKDGQAFSGTQLGAAYTFPGLQKHLGVDYRPERDDKFINKLLLKPVKPLAVYERQKLFQEIELKPQQPQFTPPAEDEMSQAKRIAPSGLTWNEIFIEAQQKQMLEQKQRYRGFSR